ncbi:hypothetical protein BK751_14005 [Bacillus thuringiensis serovar galleriae]|nr:hypothetical protein BK701_03410 [Bacillus thuringiensis serovar amagiensis]OTY70263.1 hypothetical protein BK747_10995 [Bacillus thuringiensis serovar azorensis]OTY89072.1 hypothetical protein BK751_14005 [Bacillus thuringiensis serovar galleriae]OTZ62509.1 hypothetical protein BK766_05285 [Bacillus thuringiensis serovar wuhanensis]
MRLRLKLVSIHFIVLLMLSVSFVVYVPKEAYGSTTTLEGLGDISRYNAVVFGNHMLKLGIFKKATNELIGWCCTGMKEELPSPNREIMYAISNEYQNHGYATKATKGLIDYLFKETNLNVLNAIALINNVASNKVIEKCGFIYKSQQRIENQIYNHYILRKSEWIKI